MSKTIETAKNIAEELLAVERLEYLNKNWLYHGVNPANQSLAKQDRLNDLISLLKTYLSPHHDESK